MMKSDIAVNNLKFQPLFPLDIANYATSLHQTPHKLKIEGSKVLELLPQFIQSSCEISEVSDHSTREPIVAHKNQSMNKSVAELGIPIPISVPVQAKPYEVEVKQKVNLKQTNIGDLLNCLDFTSKNSKVKPHKKTRQTEHKGSFVKYERVKRFGHIAANSRGTYHIYSQINILYIDMAGSKRNRKNKSFDFLNTKAAPIREPVWLKQINEKKLKLVTPKFIKHKPEVKRKNVSTMKHKKQNINTDLRFDDGK